MVPQPDKFVQQAHEDTPHGGVRLAMTKIREKYWVPVPRLRRLVKRLIKSCPGCKRFQATALASPPPGLLPWDRTEECTPFQVVGVDYAGAIKIRTSRKLEAKAYIVLYSCSLTRALHLHLARSIEMEEFLLCVKEFIARRGRPETFYCSDNGRIPSSEQQHGYDKWETTKAHQGISNAWLIWWRELYEGSTNLKEILLDVEVALNNRPLPYVEDDLQMPILAPTSFLHWSSVTQSNALPEMEPHPEENAPLRKRAKY